MEAGRRGEQLENLSTECETLKQKYAVGNPVSCKIRYSSSICVCWQVSLSSEQPKPHDTSLQVRSPGIGSVSSQAQPVNIWSTLQQAGLISTTDLKQKSANSGLSDAFERLALSQDAEPSSSNLSGSATRHDSAIDKPGEQQRPSLLESCSDSSRQDQPGNVLGEHFLPATLWPAKLPKGCAQLSSGMLGSFGGASAIGRRILIYKVPP